MPCLSGPRGSGASVFPAVQNMLLAARALGLGATLTTLYLIHEKETEAAMGLPDDMHSYAIVPLGFPTGKFGPVRRTALENVVYQDKWGRLIKREPIERPRRRRRARTRPDTIAMAGDTTTVPVSQRNRATSEQPSTQGRSFWNV